jgi:DNA polymerase
MTLYHLDYESRSTVPLDVRGLANYAADPSTSILCAAYAEGDNKVRIWQPHLEPKMPAELREAIQDPWVTVAAWNAGFERAITKHVQKMDKPSAEWLDPMIQARYLSIPGSLDEAGKILGLKEDQAKLKDGKRLLNMFSVPQTLGGEQTLFGVSSATFRDWRTDPKDWELLLKYCIRDVEAERTILKKMAKFPLPAQEQENWVLDQKINEAGLPVDMALVTGAGVIVERAQRELLAQIKELSGLENPNSNEQILGFLQGQGYTFGSLGKPFVLRALGGECELTPLARQVIEIRQQTSKSSVRKYTSIGEMVSPDGRLRNQFSFMGASRTGRWASRGINLQNLPRPVKAVEKKMTRALELVRVADYNTIVHEFTNPLDVVTSTIRSSFAAPPGHKLIVADLNAIENRVTGFAARCKPILDVFYEKRCPYIDFASALYSTPYDVLWAEYKAGDSSKRTYAKPATLGASYRLSGGEELVNSKGDKYLSGLLGYAKAMNVEMTKEDADRAVKLFREKYKEVCTFWYDLERAATSAIREPGKIFEVGPVAFEASGKTVLRLWLPSGRALHYIRPRVERITATSARTGKDYKKDMIYHEGKDQTTKLWRETDIHGGVFCENIAQSIARDVLTNGLKLADERGFHIILHVHDEIGCLEPEDSPLTLEDLCECMSAPVPWAGDKLPLGAEGYESIVYRK